ncbi:hypothetical protein SAMN02745130_00538 [Thiothrix eikelboomii]|uniref:UPF0250 protein SAMN02745130_00538 n=1 Tax=Thiothrix eikelboomii TaxID=92487 RepID=A0A1T4VXE1_9GAMM|nr:DUF493 domain-containing protein [Thiothrix eikelboomii]SKA69672.1 hypothetical protein SAMN02745130_00538 [Thiothrix eikelboomii]
MNTFSQSEVEIEFPSHFPIKVVGAANDQLAQIIHDIIVQHDPEFSLAAIRANQSRSGKYHSLTLGVRATSKEQLDAIYNDLKACEWVLWAL